MSKSARAHQPLNPPPAPGVGEGPRPISRQRSKWVEKPSPLPGSRLFLRNVHDGQLRTIVALESTGWHLSISHVFPGERRDPPGRYPTWDEIADARYAFLPEDVTMAMLLPPLDEYVALHPTTFHLHQIDGEPEATRIGVYGQHWRLTFGEYADAETLTVGPDRGEWDLGDEIAVTFRRVRPR